MGTLRRFKKFQRSRVQAIRKYRDARKYNPEVLQIFKEQIPKRRQRKDFVLGLHEFPGVIAKEATRVRRAFRMARLQHKGGVTGTFASGVLSVVLNLAHVPIGISSAAGVGGMVPSAWLAFRGIKRLSAVTGDDAKQLSSIVGEWLRAQTNAEIKKNAAKYSFLVIDNHNRLIFTDFPARGRFSTRMKYK